jgi:hypothetical protein
MIFPKFHNFKFVFLGKVILGYEILIVKYMVYIIEVM